MKELAVATVEGIAVKGPRGCPGGVLRALKPSWGTSGASDA
jgi:hypothetical protein